MIQFTASIAMELFTLLVFIDLSQKPKLLTCLFVS